MTIGKTVAEDLRARQLSEETLNAIAEHVREWIERSLAASPSGHVPLLFLSGPQGSGKSTALAEAIAALSVPVAGASIDDFYLARQERSALARRVSPLFETRGPPGTHDVPLLARTVTSLRRATADSATPLPVFDKLADERAPLTVWRAFHGRPAVIVIEGWLMGSMPPPPDEADAPLNAVEREDASGAWREYQSAQLAGPYAGMWDAADSFCHIVAPDFGCVLDWRLEQERGLWAAKGEPMPQERREWLVRFIQHYERITRRMLAGHRRPGAEIHIDEKRRVLGNSGC